MGTFLRGTPGTLAQDITLPIGDIKFENYINNLIFSEVLFYLNGLVNTVSVPKGVSVDFGFSRTIFLDFNFENIDTSTAQIDLLNAILKWFDFEVSESDYVVDIPAKSKLSAFPNPTRSHLNISFQPKTSLESNEIPIFSMFNIRGQRVYSGELARTDSGFDSRVNIDNLNISSGIYFIKVNTGAETAVQRVVVIR